MVGSSDVSNVKFGGPVILRQPLLIKACDIRSTSPDVPVYDALGLMAEESVRAVLVMKTDDLVEVLTGCEVQRPCGSGNHRSRA